MRRNAEMYLVVWGKPRTRSAPGRFYREMKLEFGSGVRFIQRSAYGTRAFKITQRLAESTRCYGLKVVVSQAVEIDA